MSFLFCDISNRILTRPKINRAHQQVAEKHILDGEGVIDSFFQDQKQIADTQVQDGNGQGISEYRK